MGEEAEAMANALRDTVEKLASTGSSLSLIEWSEASNRILHAASLIRSQAERIERLEAALEPFDACNFFYKNLPGDTIVSIGRWRVDMGPDEPLQFAADMQANASDFHRARAALGGPNG